VGTHRRRSVRRVLGLTALSAVAPGSAHLAVGKRRTGYALLAIFLLIAAAFAVFALGSSRQSLIKALVKPGVLTMVELGAGLAAVLWIALVVRSYLVVAPPGPRSNERALGIVVVALLCLAVAAPPAVVARYAYVQRSLITTVFPDSDVTEVNEGKPVAKDDPWKGRSRLNLLLIAADSGPDRTGTRTDSMVVFSADTHTGDVVMFSLPRNLAHAPLPKGPLADHWPDGFNDLLNALYRRVTDEKVLTGYRDPGAVALKETAGTILGLRMDYYVMINMEGFEKFVDALGGVTMNVARRLPIGGLDAVGNHVAPSGYIEPGVHHLSGFQAEWFARSRSDSSDYDRIQRQRCLIAAMSRQLAPTSMLTHFQQLASATKDLVSTDLPQRLLGPLVELADKIKATGNLRSLAFIPPEFNPNNPDFEKIRTDVQTALRPPSKPAGKSTTPKPPRSPTSQAPSAGGTKTGSTAGGPTGAGTSGKVAGSPVESVNDVCSLT
jgi:polyisoprenyl-teichoic acid--peptidoglycan teichoic acid transferase